MNRRLPMIVASSLLLAAFSPALAGDPPCHGAGAEEGKARYSATTEHYRVPPVQLVDQDGRKVDLPRLLSGDRPVALNFIFTTCTTICPVMSASFAGLGKELAGEQTQPIRVSISIDPEYDTPEVLSRYSERFGPAEDWTFLTGKHESVTKVLGAFRALFDDKMSHRALTFVHRPGGDAWLRIEGLPSAAELAREYRRFVSGEVASR